MQSLRRAWRLSLLMPVLVLFIAVGLLIGLVRNPRRRRWRIGLTRLVSRLSIRVLGIRLESPSPLPATPGLLLCNHLSYLDILVLASQRSLVFVSSRDLQQGSALGWLASLGGAIFVDRRSMARARADARQLQDVLEQGMSICLFPEATSSAGADILPYKPGLLGPFAGRSWSATFWVLGCAAIDGKPLGAGEADLVSYHGDDEFGPHLMALLGCRSIDYRLRQVEAWQHIPELAQLRVAMQGAWIRSRDSYAGMFDAVPVEAESCTQSIHAVTRSQTAG